MLPVVGQAWAFQKQPPVERIAVVPFGSCHGMNDSIIVSFQQGTNQPIPFKRCSESCSNTCSQVAVYEISAFNCSMNRNGD